MVWLEKASSALYVKTIGWKTQSSESPTLVVSLSARRELTKISPHSEFYGTDVGVWVAEKPYNKIQFWDFLTSTGTSEDVFARDFEKGMRIRNLPHRSGLFLLQHPITREVVVLSEHGKIAFCSHIKNKVRLVVSLVNSAQGKVTVASQAVLSDCKGEAMDITNCLGVDIMHSFLILYYPNLAKVS